MKLKNHGILVDISEDIENIDEIQNFDGEKNFKVEFLHGLSEANFDKEKRLAHVTVIREGTSHNGFKYGIQALSDVAEHLNTHAKKVYLNHLPKNSKETRKVQDWIADVVSAQVVQEGSSHKVTATIKVHETGPNAWIYDRMKASPDSFGPSIVGKAKVRVAQEGARKIKVVESIPILASFDIVANPSAGGTVDSVMESIMWDDGDENISEELKDYVEKLKKRKADRQIADDYYDLLWPFESMLSDLVLAKGEFEMLSVDDRRSNVTKLLSDFAGMVTKLKFAEPKKEEKKTTKPTDDDKTVTKEEVQESKTFDLEENSMNLEKLKAEHPELYKQIVQEARDAYIKEQETSTLSEENESLKTQLQETKDSLAKVTEERDKLDTENVALKETVKESRKIEIEARKKELISECIKESGLTTEQVSEHFNEKLNSFDLDTEDENAFKTTVLAECTDRLETIKEATKSTKTIRNNGKPSAPKAKDTNTETVSEDKKFPKETKTFAHELKLSRR